MDILNKVTGQLMAGIEDVESFFSGIAADVHHEWQCLTSDGEPVVEPTVPDDGTFPVPPDAKKYSVLELLTAPDMGISGVISERNPLGLEFMQPPAPVPEPTLADDSEPVKTDRGVSGVPSVENPLGLTFGESVVMTPEYFAAQDAKNAAALSAMNAMAVQPNPDPTPEVK